MLYFFIFLLLFLLILTEKQCRGSRLHQEKCKGCAKKKIFAPLDGKITPFWHNYEKKYLSLHPNLLTSGQTCRSTVSRTPLYI